MLKCLRGRVGVGGAGPGEAAECAPALSGLAGVLRCWWMTKTRVPSSHPTRGALSLIWGLNAQEWHQCLEALCVLLFGESHGCSRFVCVCVRGMCVQVCVGPGVCGAGCVVQCVWCRVWGGRGVSVWSMSRVVCGAVCVVHGVWCVSWLCRLCCVFCGVLCVSAV